MKLIVKKNKKEYEILKDENGYFIIYEGCKEYVNIQPDLEGVHYAAIRLKKNDFWIGWMQPILVPTFNLKKALSGGWNIGNKAINIEFSKLELKDNKIQISEILVLENDIKRPANLSKLIGYISGMILTLKA